MSIDTRPRFTEVPEGPDLVPARSRRRRRWTAVVAIAALLVAGLVANSWWSRYSGDVRHGTTVVDARGMAAAHGINVTLVGVTAAGGLLDFRYQVVDPDKANQLLHDPALAPTLVVEETGETLVMSATHRHGKADLKLGGSYFFLLANAHNAVKRGTKVTLVIGDVRIEHLVADA